MDMIFWYYEQIGVQKPWAHLQMLNDSNKTYKWQKHKIIQYVAKLLLFLKEVTCIQQKCITLFKMYLFYFK